jgi:preprotein translocase subunit SecF
MLQLFGTPRWDFIGRRRWAYAVSSLLMLAGLASLATQGLRYDLDFTGGALVQVRFERPPDVQRLRGALEPLGLGDSVIQEYGSASEYIVRLPLATASSEEVAGRVSAAFAADAGLGAFEVRRADFVGPQVGRDLQRQAVYAVALGLLGILLYIALRFDLKGAVAAVVAVFHDVVICLGAISIARLEFSLPVLAALLTVIGYQVNDTIVAYDRLRENRARVAGRGRPPFAEEMNAAVNQTLSRTVLTALTVFLCTAVLYVFGGRALEGFAFVLLVGVLAGTYSTIYVAGALVVDWTLHAEGRLLRGRRRAART